MSLKNIVLFWVFVSNIICFMLSIVIANASLALFYFTTSFLCLNLIFCYWIYRSEAHTSQYVFLDVIPTKYVYMMFWFQLLILSFSYFDIFALLIFGNNGSKKLKKSLNVIKSPCSLLL